jgi:hypothetical protein
VWREMFGPGGGGDMYRKLLNEGLCDFYSLPNTIKMMKSRKMRLTEHVANMREKRNAYRVLLENLKERDHSEYLGLHWRIILSGS